MKKTLRRKFKSLSAITHMEPKKSYEEIEKEVNNEEEEIWEEVEADDSKKTLEEDEDEWEEIEEEIEVEVEEEDEQDPEIEEDPEEEEEPEEETEDDNKKEEKDDIDSASPSTPLSKNFNNTAEKRETNSEEDNQKKSLSGGRVWCQEDEITILEGLIEYKNSEGTYPPNDMVEFHEFIKWKLQSSEISRIQTYEKIKRLKKKFLLNLEKLGDLVEPVFSKSHDYALFHLSRKIWGEDCNNNTNNTITRKRKREKKDMKSKKKHLQTNENNSSFRKVKKEDTTIMKDEEEEEGDFEKKFPFLSEALWKESSGFDKLADGVKRVLKKKLSSIGSAKAKELEMEWKKIREQESVIFLQKLNLIALQTQLMTKKIKKP